MHFIIIFATTILYCFINGQSHDMDLNPKWMGALNEVPTIDESIYNICANTTWTSGMIYIYI